MIGLVLVWQDNSTNFPVHPFILVAIPTASFLYRMKSLYMFIFNSVVVSIMTGCS